MRCASGSLRHFGRIKNGTTPPSGESDYWDGDVLWATPEDLGNLTTDRIFRTKRKVTRKAVAECNLSVLPVGSVLISTRAPIGHMAINEEPMAFNQGCRGIVPGDSVDGPFLYYLLKSRSPELNAMANGTTFVELSRDELASVPVAFPPLDTQRRIARYLNEKTARIDGLIEKKQKLLDRLAEHRQALITRSVTKGIGPDAPRGNRGTEQKAGGMPEISLPPSWSFTRLKHLATYNDEALPESTDEELGIDYVEIAGVSLHRGIHKIQRMTFGQAPSRARRKVRTGDILISTVWTYLRTIARVDWASPDLVVSTGFCVVRPNDDVDSGFLGWAAKSEPFVSEAVARSVGAIYPAINSCDLVSIRIPVPPLNTQRQIARYLNEETVRIDAATKQILRSIVLLSEYRSALVTGAVTGQCADPQ